MQRLKEYIQTKFQKHPVKLMSYKQLLQQCLDAGRSQEYCHNHACLGLYFDKNMVPECNDYPVGTYQHDVQDCVMNKTMVGVTGGGTGGVITRDNCHTYVCDELGRDYPECDKSKVEDDTLEYTEVEDDTLEYIILFVIIGLICYGGYKYFKK